MNPLIIAADGLLLDDVFLNDDSPSSAVENAHFDPVVGTVRITFKNGDQTYSFPCSLSQWLEYRNSDSKGSAISSVFGVRGGRK